MKQVYRPSVPSRRLKCRFCGRAHRRVPSVCLERGKLFGVLWRMSDKKDAQTIKKLTNLVLAVEAITKRSKS